MPNLNWYLYEIRINNDVFILLPNILNSTYVFYGRRIKTSIQYLILNKMNNIGVNKPTNLNCFTAIMDIA